MQNKNKFFNKLFIGLALIILMQSFLQNTQGVLDIFSTIMGYLMPFIYAVFFAIVLQPLSYWFETRFSLKRELSISLSVLSLILSMILIVLIVVPGITLSIKQLIEKLPQYQVILEERLLKLIKFLNSKDVIALTPQDLEIYLNNFFSENIILLRKVVTSISLNFIHLLIVLGQMLLGFFIAIFLVYDREYFEKLIHNVIFLFSSKDAADSIVSNLDSSRVLFLNYMWGKFLVSVALSIIVFIFMFIGGVPYALLISILLIFGNMVPYVGMLVVMILGTLFVGIEDPSKLWILYVANILGNQIEGFYLAPKIIGKTVGLSSFWVLTGVLLGGALMGPVGMILGVPAVGIIKLLYRQSLNKKIKNK